MTTFQLRDTDGTAWFAVFLPAGDRAPDDHPDLIVYDHPSLAFYVGEPDDPTGLCGRVSLRNVNASYGLPLDFPALRAQVSMDAVTADRVRSWAARVAYNVACVSAATSQGLDPITSTLAAAGVEYSVEQTGGFCMAVTVRVTTGTYAVTNEGEDGPLLAFYVGDAWTKSAETQWETVLAWTAFKAWAHAAAVAQTVTSGAQG